MPKTPTHGGLRKGADPRRLLGNPVRVTVVLEANDLPFLKQLGGGKLSPGLRQTIELVRKEIGPTAE